jgi:hypothetical protein
MARNWYLFEDDHLAGCHVYSAVDGSGKAVFAEKIAAPGIRIIPLVSLTISAYLVIFETLIQSRNSLMVWMFSPSNN